MSAVVLKATQLLRSNGMSRRARSCRDRPVDWEDCRTAGTALAARHLISPRRSRAHCRPGRERKSCDGRRGDPERQLQGQRALFGWRVVEASAVDCQRQGRRADTILDPAIIQSTQERELHDGFVEVPHRIHVASKDDGVVDLANLAEWLHGGPL
jgi:hypothetical protein